MMEPLSVYPDGGDLPLENGGDEGPDPSGPGPVKNDLMYSRLSDPQSTGDLGLSPSPLFQLKTYFKTVHALFLGMKAYKYKLFYLGIEYDRHSNSFKRHCQ